MPGHQRSSKGCGRSRCQFERQDSCDTIPSSCPSAKVSVALDPPPPIATSSYVFARAALSDRPFVLLDEPTSLLDPELDIRIQELSKRIFNGRTVVCVAHKLDSIADYDLVLWIERGRLVEMGEAFSILERFQQQAV